MSKREQSPAPSSQDMTADADISTTPAYRHQGIGTALVNAALHALANEGIIKVALVVFSRNDAGNAFWESLGFTARGDLTYRNKALCAITRIDT